VDLFAFKYSTRKTITIACILLPSAFTSLLVGTLRSVLNVDCRSKIECHLFNHLLGVISPSSSLASKYIYTELLAAVFIQLQSIMAEGNINMLTLTTILTLTLCVLSSAWIVVPCAEVDRWPDQDRHYIPEMKQKLINISTVELTVEDVWLQVTEPTGWEVSFFAKGSNAPGVHNRARLVKESLRGRATDWSTAVI